MGRFARVVLIGPIRKIEKDLALVDHRASQRVSGTSVKHTAYQCVVVQPLNQAFRNLSSRLVPEVGAE